MQEFGKISSPSIITCDLLLNYFSVHLFLRHTIVGIHSYGVLARGTAPDPDIYRNVTGAQW
jgi:hypothetical protein